MTTPSSVNQGSECMDCEFVVYAWTNNLLKICIFILEFPLENSSIVIYSSGKDNISWIDRISWAEIQILWELILFSPVVVCICICICESKVNVDNIGFVPQTECGIGKSFKILWHKKLYIAFYWCLLGEIDIIHLRTVLWSVGGMIYGLLFPTELFPYPHSNTDTIFFQDIDMVMICYSRESLC